MCDTATTPDANNGHTRQYDNSYLVHNNEIGVMIGVSQKEKLFGFST